MQLRRPPLRERLLPWGAATLLFPLYSAVSLLRHRRMESSGFDLGIFEEAVRGYASPGAPVVRLKGTGFNLLGDHSSPALALLAPLYRLHPAAGTLLVAQAALLALSAIPVTALAVELTGRARGVALGLAYGLSWGLQHAAAFDFHEIALAVPLVACTAVALARGRYGAAVGWAVPLLLVKEDQAVLLAAVGLYVLARGRRRLGLLTVLLAAGATLLLVQVVVPAFNPDGAYSYGALGGPGGGNPLARLLLPGVKARTALALLAPTLFVALRSPLVLLAAAPLAARFWVTNPAYWNSDQHYDAVLMPVLFAALLDGLRRLVRSGGPGRLPHLLPRLLPGAVLAVAVGLTAVLPVGRLFTAGPWQVDGRVVQARRVLAVVPDGATVAAANRLAPQLTGRCEVSLFPYLTPPGAAGTAGTGTGDWRRPVADWVAVLDDPGDFPVPEAEQARVRAGLPGAGYREVASGGGVAVYHWEG